MDVLNIKSLSDLMDFGRGTEDGVHALLTGLSAFGDNGLLVYRYNSQNTAIADGFDVIRPTALITGKGAWERVSSYKSRLSVRSITANTTLTTKDTGTVLYYNGTTDITLTFPSGLGVGFAIKVIQLGTGSIVLAGGSGVTINNAYNYTKTGMAYAVVTATSYLDNTFISHGTML